MDTSSTGFARYKPLSVRPNTIWWCQASALELIVDDGGCPAGGGAGEDDTLVFIGAFIGRIVLVVVVVSSSLSSTFFCGFSVRTGTAPSD
jgi:hypothetical protein